MFSLRVQDDLVKWSPTNVSHKNKIQTPPLKSVAKINLAFYKTKHSGLLTELPIEQKRSINQPGFGHKMKLEIRRTKHLSKAYIRYLNSIR